MIHYQTNQIKVLCFTHAQQAKTLKHRKVSLRFSTWRCFTELKARPKLGLAKEAWVDSSHRQAFGIFRVLRSLKKSKVDLRLRCNFAYFCPKELLVQIYLHFYTFWDIYAHTHRKYTSLPAPKHHSRRPRPDPAERLAAGGPLGRGSLWSGDLGGEGPWEVTGGPDGLDGCWKMASFWMFGGWIFWRLLEGHFQDNGFTMFCLFFSGGANPSFSCVFGGDPEAEEKHSVFLLLGFRHGEALVRALKVLFGFRQADRRNGRTYARSLRGMTRPRGFAGQVWLSGEDDDWSVLWCTFCFLVFLGMPNYWLQLTKIFGNAWSHQRDDLWSWVWRELYVVRWGSQDSADFLPLKAARSPLLQKAALP